MTATTASAPHTREPSQPAIAPRRARTRKRRRVGLWIQLIVLGVIALAWVYPLLWTFSASLKDSTDIFSSGFNLIPKSWHWENYARAWTQAGFSQYMLNSVLVTVGSVVVVVIRCATAGYVLGRYKFYGKKVVFAVLLGATFIPTGLSIIPIVELSNRLGLLNTTTGLILALSAGGNVAAVLLYAGFYAQLPKELEDAAMIDGAGFFRTFFSVMLPLSGPITATVTVVTFISTWSNFFIPLVFTFSDPSKRTLAVGMLAFQGTDSTDWSGLAAGASMSLIPVFIVFIFLQRFFVEGIAGAVKN